MHVRSYLNSRYRRVVWSFSWSMLLAVVASSLIPTAALAQRGRGGMTRLNPAAVDPGGTFTVVDAPAGRLRPGSVALFTLNGVTVEIDLETQRSGRVAQGTIPAGFAPGVYTVSVRRGGGNAFEVGVITVNGEATVIVDSLEVTIEPTAAAPVTPVVVTDPYGRIVEGDFAIFYLPGTVPENGTLALNPLATSPDGTILLFTVPFIAPGDYLVTVRSSGNVPRFADLAFTVLSSF